MFINKKVSTTQKMGAKTSFSLAGLAPAIISKPVFADVTTSSAVTSIQNNVKWGFGVAGIVLALIGLGLFFLAFEDGPAARRSPIMMMIGGLVIVGVGFAIAAAITPPPGS